MKKKYIVSVLMGNYEVASGVNGFEIVDRKQAKLYTKKKAKKIKRFIQMLNSDISIKVMKSKPEPTFANGLYWVITIPHDINPNSSLWLTKENGFQNQPLQEDIALFGCKDSADISLRYIKSVFPSAKVEAVQLCRENNQDTFT